jgi:hypothetical protein
MTVYLLLWIYQVSDPHDQLHLTAAAMPAQQAHPLPCQRAGNTRGMNFRNTGFFVVYRNYR